MLYILMFILFIMGVALVLRSVGLIGQTAVERMVFEQSYQKQSADDARLRHLQAQCAVVSSEGRAALTAQIIAAGGAGCGR